MPPVLLGLVPDLINKAVDMFDKKFQTDAEKEQAKAEFAAQAKAQIESAWQKEQEQITKRHENDMHSDSWLSKNVRPMALVYLMALFTMAFFLDVPETVLEMLRDLLMTVFAFYFGLRTFEKAANMYMGKRGK